MKTKDKIKELEQEIERLKKLVNEEIVYEDDKLKIIKWENKPISDLPKGTEFATFQEFINLIDNKKFEMEIGFDYYTKHFSKTQWDTEYCFSRVYLLRDGSLDSIDSSLSYSIDDGRVVIKK